jgi:molybdopterin molybdotransferase
LFDNRGDVELLLNNMMISAVEAEARILALVDRANFSEDVEQISLSQAAGRILAEPICSQLDFPHWDNSAMDGYAVRYDDVKQVSTDAPVALTLRGEIAAGQPPQVSVNPGQAARIFTGAMMPAGADTIVIQEVTESTGQQVNILEAPQFGQFVRRQGSFYRAGEPLLPRGTCLQAAEIAVLAAAQCARVTVYRRPRVAILSTGNELVSPEQPLQPGQIVDSNQYALAAMVQQVGGVPHCLGIVPDQPEALKASIRKALVEADVILSSGGVSVGDYDYVDKILAELGATLHIRSVAVKPGKPLTVASFKPSGLNPVNSSETLYFGLPGNPVSALVSFWRFVAPAIRKRSGLSQGWSPVFVPATTQYPLKAGGTRETYLWGNLAVAEQGLIFELAGGSHSSGNLINLAGTNALAVVPVGTSLIEAGAPVRAMLLGDLRSRLPADIH